MGSYIGVETIRVKAANEIKNINLIINKILELQDDEQKIQYLTLNYPELNFEGLPLQLEIIDKNLIDLRLKYHKNDEKIIF